VELDFIKLSPAKNTTVLITNYVPPSKYCKVASQVLSYTYLCAEQLGFITEPQHKSGSIIRLEMSGGEFCGNAVLALAAYVRYAGILEEDNFTIESSGVNSLLRCQIINKRNNCYRVKASMPLDFNYRLYKFDVLKGVLIEFKGITHFLFENRGQLEGNKIKKLIKTLSCELKVAAMGFIPYKMEKDSFQIEPCIYVSETDSLIFENSCGSGTLALGLFLAMRKKESVVYNIKQPGGIIKVQIKGRYERGDFKVQDAFIENEVQITCSGKVLVDI